MTTDELETAILRRMTPGEKLAVMHALWRQAWNLKGAGVRREHPDWTPEQVTARVRELFGGRPARSRPRGRGGGVRRAAFHA